MSQPVATQQQSWWADLSAQQFRLIVESAVAIPGIDDILPTDDVSVGRVLPDRVPDDVATVFSASMRPEAFRHAYWNAFRAYVAAHPEAGDDGKRGVVKRWPLLTNLEPQSDRQTAARKQLLTNLGPRYKNFRRELIKLCTKIGKVVNDESVTGERKPGRVWLRHQGIDPLVKVGGKKVYRTAEGYLAHKRGPVQLTSGGRGREDWMIMIDRATRHVQTMEATEDAVKGLLGKYGDEDGNFEPAEAWNVITEVRDMMLAMKAASLDETFRGAVANAYEVWFKAADKAHGKFAEIPRYAAGRIEGTMVILRSKSAGVTEFCATTFPKFADAHKAEIQGGKFTDLDAYEEFLVDAASVLQQYLNAFQSVYDAIVDGGQQFYDWLCAWTKEQKEKGLRTEHVWVWACCEAAKLTLQAASLAAGLTFTVLSMGTAAVISAPLFVGADVLCEKLTDKIKQRFIDEDIEALDKRARAAEYLGEEYRTAGERVLGKAYGVYEKVAKGGKALETLDEWRERAAVAVEVTGAIAEKIQEAIDAEGLEKLKEGQELLEKITDPAKALGTQADIITGGVVGGLKLGIAVVGDTITLVCPPKLTKVVGDAGVKVLERALDHALDAMSEEERQTLKGELRKNKAREAMIVKKDRDFTLTITLPDGTPWQPNVRLDEKGHTVWETGETLAIVLTRSAPRAMAARLPGGWAPDFAQYIYAVHKDSTVAGDDYDPADADQAAIVRFGFTDFWDAADDNGTIEKQVYVVHSVQGQPLKKDGSPWGSAQSYQEVQVTVEGKVSYVGPTRASVKHRPRTKIRRKGVKQVTKLVDVVLTSGN
ncbi:hypothetical protein [Amycolatopsis sp. lyj-23]|uniref:hypothetical protein n=1 Tax=Amycolatopsis sp. lyj-23 TaxID=2789283 RepID=UPI003979AA25